MSGDLVDTQPGRKPDTALKSVLLDQTSSSVFDQLSDLRHGHPWFDRLPGVRSDLAMNLGGSTDGVIIRRRIPLRQSFPFSRFFRCYSRRRTISELWLVLVRTCKT